MVPVHVLYIKQHPGNNPSLVTLHRGEDSYTPAAETDTQLNSTGNHDKQNVSYQFQLGTEPDNTVTDTTDTCIQVGPSGKREEHGTSTGYCTKQHNWYISNNLSLDTLQNAPTTYTPTSEMHNQYIGNDFDQSSLLHFEHVPEPVFTIQLDIPPMYENTLIKYQCCTNTCTDTQSCSKSTY